MMIGCVFCVCLFKPVQTNSFASAIAILMHTEKNKGDAQMNNIHIGPLDNCA